MKFTHFLSAMLLTLAIASCGKDTTTVVDSSKPSGTFTPAKTGSFVAQNGTNSAGTASLGTDASGVQFLKLGSDFTSVFATGTLTVYLSTSMTYKADPGAGNPDLKLLGISQKAGETYFKIDPGAASKFTHVILWCGSATIPFGYAELK